MTEVKWQRYCRLCANKKNHHQLVSLVDNGRERFDITRKIVALHIQFSNQDNLPQEICQNCLPRLEMMFLFLTSCRKAQSKLIQLAHSGINFKDNIMVSNEDKKSNNVQSRESTRKLLIFKPTIKTKSKDTEQKTFTLESKEEPIEQKTLPVVSGYSIGEEPIVNEYKSEDKISNGMKIKTEIIKPCDIKLDVDPWEMELENDQEDPLNTSPDDSKHCQESIPIDPAGPHHCSLCNKTFKTPSGYKFHAKSVHSLILPHLCELCGKRFNHQTNLNAHRKTHLSEDLRKLVQCIVCDKKFINKFLLKEHLNGHYNLKPFFCSVCDKSFTSSHNLQRHSLTHNRDTKYECAVCGKYLMRRRSLVVHLRRHGEALKFRCVLCDTRFETRGQLRTHGTKVHTQEDMRERKRVHDKNVVKCPSCPKLLSRTTLTNHVRTFHSGQSFPISCEICGKGLAGRASLAYHIKAIHSEQGGDWTCIYCGQKFMTRILLSRHEYKHTGDTPFKCPQCNKGFRSLSTLHQHRLVHESPSPQHTCQICNKQFKRKANLDVHSRIHSGNLPFSCPDCNKTFAQKNDMLKHHRARHSATLQNIIKTNGEVKETKEHNEQIIIDYEQILGDQQESPITQIVLRNML